jgi:hypothetical protein
MRVFNVEVQQYDLKPTGIMADVDLGDDVFFLATREWDNPQWYLWDVVLGKDRWGNPDSGFRSVGVEQFATKREGGDQFPIYHDSPLGQALHKAVLEEGLQPATWQD